MIQRSLFALVLVAALQATAATAADDLCRPDEIEGTLHAQDVGIRVTRAGLLTEHNTLVGLVGEFQDDCGTVRRNTLADGACGNRRGPLQERVSAYVKRCLAFNVKLKPVSTGNRVQNCNLCCGRAQAACFNTGAKPLCDTEYGNCIATCTSEGQVPSTWGPQCWLDSPGK